MKPACRIRCSVARGGAETLIRRDGTGRSRAPFQDRGRVSGRRRSTTFEEQHLDGSGKEIGGLISSQKVEGTSVENAKGDDLGHVHDIMIDKASGRVGYAVLKYGSFLGMGGKLFALPWDQLKYDTNRGAYIVDLPVETLRDGPSYDETTQPNWSDRTWNRGIHDYYGSRADWFSTY